MPPKKSNAAAKKKANNKNDELPTPVQEERNAAQQIEKLKESLGALSLDGAVNITTLLNSIEGLIKTKIQELEKAVKDREKEINKMKESQDKELNSLKLQLEKHKGDIAVNNSKIVDLEKKLTKQQTIINGESERFSTLATNQENADQFNRLNQVVFSGNGLKTLFDEITPEDDFNKKAADFLFSKFSLPTEVNLQQCIFKKFGKNSDSLITTVPSYDVTKKLIDQSRLKKLPNLYANEYLIPPKLKLLQELRRRKKDSNEFFQVFVLRGQVYVRRNATADKIKVKSLSDVA